MELFVTAYIVIAVLVAMGFFLTIDYFFIIAAPFWPVIAVCIGVSLLLRLEQQTWEEHLRRKNAKDMKRVLLGGKYMK